MSVVRKIFEVNNKAGEIYVEKCLDILDRIHYLMEKQGLSTAQLAEKMLVTEDQVYDWTHGLQDFELSTIAAFEGALGEEIITINAEEKI